MGILVEHADTKELFTQPKHPYTEALLGAVPKPDPRDRAEPVILEGDVTDPANPPSGCYFHLRCLYSDGDRCVTETPTLEQVSPGHFARCHYAAELTLRDVEA